ncbi:putative Agenet-like domain-containing protein [Helianthus anomalus]
MALLDYIDGKWVVVRPKPKDEDRFICRVGLKVEISLEDERFCDVWFPATIVQDLGNNWFLVEYKELQRVSVDHLHIRPLRPDFRDHEFHFSREVEAFYEFGWWSGVVTKEVADSRYIVCFKHTNKVKEFSLPELRTQLKWHWEKEIWFFPPKPIRYGDRLWPPQESAGSGSGSSSSSSSCSDSSVDLQDSAAQIVNGTSNSVEKSLGSVSEVSNQNGDDGSVKKLSSRSRSGAELTSQKENSNTPTKGKRGRSTFISNIESEERVAGQTPSVNFDIPPSITIGNDQKPSFEKRSSFWETSQSIEAFRLFPQNPHFRPLDKINECARERHAIHKMVAFVGVFEDMCRLRRDHPRSEIEDQLQTLLELETHGFDVDSLRDRLMEMLSWRDKREALETGSKKPQGNLEIERVKVQERNKDVVLIDSQIDELRDKRQRLVKENEESRLNIVAWEKEIEDVEEAKCECDRKFFELATARFKLSRSVC